MCIHGINNTEDVGKNKRKLVDDDENKVVKRVCFGNGRTATPQIPT